jgi:hypothetical protein
MPPPTMGGEPEAPKGLAKKGVQHGPRAHWQNQITVLTGHHRGLGPRATPPSDAAMMPKGKKAQDLWGFSGTGPGAVISPGLRGRRRGAFGARRASANP